MGANGIAFDVHGDLYALANAQNTLVRLAPDGGIETLATVADRLDFPAAIAFGRGRLDHESVYIVNLAIAGPATGPSIVDVDVGATGQPLP